MSSRDGNFSYRKHSMISLWNWLQGEKRPYKVRETYFKKKKKKAIWAPTVYELSA
jgi:hypothetical protein